MRGARLGGGLIVALSACMFADSNLRITDVGLHGYLGSPSAVRMVVRNPSAQPQSIHLQLQLTGGGWGDAHTVSSDLSLAGSEQRELELPMLIRGGFNKITADAIGGGRVFGHDAYVKGVRRANMIALMCSNDEICKTTQSQIAFSGSVNDRADKNRNAAFEVVNDAREDWWAYTAATGVVLATPMKKFSAEQRNALEGFLRRGGRMVLVEDEIADPEFLSEYRKAAPSRSGERAGRGMLFRVSSVAAVGEVFTGGNLPAFLMQASYQSVYLWNTSGPGDWMRWRFATVFNFPQLRWLLIWLAIYIVVIGIVNFGILRRLKKLELGWISTCGLALVFAAGFYYSGASRRPKDFRLDNLPTYYLDGRSPLAAANYEVRVSTPERRDVAVSVKDPAVFIDANLNGREPNSQIWTEMNRQAAQFDQALSIRLGPPREVELPMLKWSFRDLSLEGLHEFPGTVHLVGLKRLRNDTGQQLFECVYLDYDAGQAYPIPALPSGEEIQLDTITPMAIPKNEQGVLVGNPNLDQTKAPLVSLGLAGSLPVRAEGRVFAGFSDGPALPVELNVPHEKNVHSLIIVALEQP